jgi:histidyl-tRNA synthetase
MSKQKTIRPEIPAGFRDYLPEDAIARQSMLDKIRAVFERFGFNPLETPHVEKLEVLTGGQADFRMHLFATKVVKGGKLNNLSPGDLDNEWALRFDQTVPLARVMAANLSLPKPFKRYAYGSVFRGERPQAGRLREFKQFDADIVGVKSVLADAEIIALMAETMLALEIDDFIVRLNNRKILNALATFAGFDSQPERVKEVFRILDKLDKIGWQGVAKELKRQPDNQYDIAPALSAADIDKIKQFLDIQGNNQQILSALEKIFADIPIGLEGVAELSAIADYLKSFGIKEKYWQIDLSVARGLDYYTGPVFETVIKSAAKFNIGSVFSGGRYDRLIDRFVANVNITATGASLGFDRFYELMVKLGKIKPQNSVTQVLVANFDPDLIDDCLSITATLRRAGIKTEFYLGEGKGLKDQLTYALKNNIPFMLIYGSDEKESQVVVVKDLEGRVQTKQALKDVHLYLKEKLEGKNKKN